MIRAESIIKTFNKVRVLDKLSLSVKEGSIYGLVGPNGAGKTTLIKNLVGIFRPDRGEIWIDGEKVEDRAEIKGRFGYVAPRLVIIALVNYLPRHPWAKMAYGPAKRSVRRWKQ